MRRIKELIKGNKHIGMAVPGILVMLWFFAMERLVDVPVYYIETALDGRIPFLKIFVIPYVFWYFYVAAPLVYFFFKSPGDFIKLALFLCLGMGIACYIFTVFPNGQLLRPRLAGSDALTLVMNHIYGFDTPTNSLPSIHVIYAIGVHCALLNYKGPELKWLLKPSLIAMVLISVSTVFVKQHSVLDVLAGVAVAGVIYAVVYRKKVGSGVTKLEKSAAVDAGEAA